MSSELPKEFQKTSEVLPFSKYGLSSLEEFKNTEKDVQHLEWLKKVGLSEEEIKLYEENEAGLLTQKTKVESNALKRKLEVLYAKISDNQNNKRQPNIEQEALASTSSEDDIKRINKSGCFYAPGHPINDLKKLEEELFGHLQDQTISITKRRKIIRRLERKRERLLAQQKTPNIDPMEGPSQIKPGSLWDVQKMPDRMKLKPKKPIMGPFNKTMYTVKDNKIVRLEPTENNEEYKAVDIVLPVNSAEQQLLEGTQMKIDDIRKIERFKDYEPGIPSKVLFLKNIAPSLKHEQLALLFNQFQMENGGPVDLKLMSGRMHGQAFATFQKEHIAIQALAEINGTILGGQPIIAQFGRNSNRIQVEENR
ncbi:RNA-binding protein 41-like [Aricia agestis]|uniref:RNA-binding protein 41-like n=1 Tax=Aricia agestis TaxID=91739 RepID=UPI001C207FCD|nr:RNA-binding protein 41-like [Aricia agestis]